MTTLLTCDGLTMLRNDRGALDEYEIRVVSYCGLIANMPYKLGSCSIEPGYECETDCELREWEDRANEDRSWVCWWEADWLDPEEYDYD